MRKLALLRLIDERRARSRLYSLQRKKYLALHETCEKCGIARATHIHHKISRKTHLTDVTVFMACCLPCERSFHE